MMTVMKKPKAKDETSGKATLKHGKASVKQNALRQIVLAAIKSGTAPPQLLAAAKRKWGANFSQEPSPKAQSTDSPRKKRALAEESPKPSPKPQSSDPPRKKRALAEESPKPSPKPQSSDPPRKKRALAEESPKSSRPPKKRKASEATDGQPPRKAFAPAQKRNVKETQEEEDLSGLSKKQQKVHSILKKTIKPQNLSKKERRALRVARRKDGNLVRQLLLQWEELRAGHCAPDRRTEICADIIAASRGKIKDLILAHDTSRVFESVMKHGTTEQRLLVLEEIKKDVPQLMKTKFAKFVVKKMLLHGSHDHKVHVFSALDGAVPKMFVHRQAVEVLDLAFNDHANATQRANIIQEVFGPPFSLFKIAGVSKLSEAFAAEPKANKETVLAHVKDVLTQAIAKGSAKYYIVHYLLLDFLETCCDADRVEISQLLKEQIVPLLHTREGVKVAMSCLWNANNKDRKVILKCMKTFIANTAVDEHGYLFILAVLDAMDDIVFLNKTIMKELFESMESLFASVHGRKVLLYMLDRRNPCYFHPQLLDNILRKGDGNPHTKKSADVRTQELRERCLPVLLRFASENMAAVCASNGGLMVLREILTHGGGLPDPYKLCVRALVRCLASKEKVCEGEETAVESSAAHLALKKTLQRDRDHGNHFSTQLMQELDEAIVEAIVDCNRGCFLLVHLCEANEAAVKLLKSLKASSSVSKKNFPGAKILTKKLSGA